MSALPAYQDSESTLAAIDEQILSCEMCYERLQVCCMCTRALREFFAPRGKKTLPKLNLTTSRQ